MREEEKKDAKVAEGDLSNEGSYGNLSRRRALARQGHRPCEQVSVLLGFLSPYPFTTTTVIFSSGMSL